MEFQQTLSNGSTVLRIVGEFDSITAPDLRPTFDDVASRQPQKVVLDLSGLRLIDSSGIGAIVSLFKRVRAYGGVFEVSGVQGQPRSIFKVLRLDKVFDIA
ncbi:MAG TPA: STAS domain-containing protein [Polyangiaceae bacterium]|jgi:anti-sigma B factor antagonist|nr:STAS domain-containing protein [Polyangiaceae bacterium]